MNHEKWLRIQALKNASIPAKANLIRIYSELRTLSGKEANTLARIIERLEKWQHDHPKQF